MNRKEEPAIDLQLPVQRSSQVLLQEIPLPKEPKISYKEKTVTSLGPSSGITAPKIVFKKRKVTSGAHNMRKKEDS